jgi:hypothetical protein
MPTACAPSREKYLGSRIVGPYTGLSAIPDSRHPPCPAMIYSYQLETAALGATLTSSQNLAG